jgi:hypothetical protein
MRKRHGVRPSITGFYHEKIYSDVEKQNIEFSKIRASRVAVWRHNIFELFLDKSINESDLGRSLCSHSFNLNKFINHINIFVLFLVCYFILLIIMNV